MKARGRQSSRSKSGADRQKAMSEALAWRAWIAPKYRGEQMEARGSSMDGGKMDRSIWSKEFSHCAMNGDLASMKAMAVRGLGIDERDERGGTALILACARGRVEVARWLIEEGADVDAKNRRGWNSAMAASKSSSDQCLAALLSAGCDLDAVDGSGNTALMIASEYAHEAGGRSCVGMLLAGGCSLGRVAGQMANPLAHAIRQGWSAAAGMIEAEKERRDLSEAVGPARAVNPPRM
jgi:hypothetical protein